MGTRSTITGYWRQRGNSGNSTRTGPTPAVLLASVEVTFDPSVAAGTLTGVVLPKGAVPSFAKITNAGGTGAAGRTVDVGVVGTNDALINEGDADTASAAIVTNGTALDSALAADTEIVAGAGAAPATGGTVTARIFYYLNDDQKLA